MTGKTMDERVEQLRRDMTDGISAIRRGVSDDFEQFRSELQEDIAGLGRDMAQGFLRLEETMGALFEEYLGHRSVIAEGHPALDEPPGGS